MDELRWFYVKEFTAKKLKTMLEQKELSIDTNYQRSLVWKLKQKKGLIETISISYPLGTLVVIEKNEKLELIDGQQRLNAISEFLDDKFTDSDDKFFSQLKSNTQHNIENYRIPIIVLNQKLSKDEISSIFVRLQEGTPLSTAEKVYAFTGKFRQTFVDAFFDEKNLKFFSRLSDKRFRARLVAAHLLAIELESNYDKDKFPAIDFPALQEINEHYKHKEIPLQVVKRYNDNIQFLGEHLAGLLKKIRVREITPAYLLVSYMRLNKTLDDSTGLNLQKFMEEFFHDLEKFSIYDEESPKGMDDKVFRSLMRYKAYSRQGLTKESLKERLETMKTEFKNRTGKRV